MTPTTNEKYNSRGVPHGGFFVDIYRPANPTASDPASDHKLARYLVESCNPSASGNVTKRPGTDGGKGGWFLVEGDMEGQAVIQRSVTTSPTVGNGDYFDAHVRIDADGNTVAERFVIHTPDHARDPGYRKQSVTVIVDDAATGVVATDSQVAV